jgi:hypothetical protein
MGRVSRSQKVFSKLALIGYLMRATCNAFSVVAAPRGLPDECRADLCL